MSIEHDSVAAVVARALSPGRFFVAPPGRLRIEFAEQQTVPWEIFNGHLVEPAHTRQSIVADVWNVYLDREAAAEAPLIVLVHEREAARLHVTRQILVYGAEAYEESPGVILTRDVQKWVRELVASLDLRAFDVPRLTKNLEQAVFRAVVGISRLPITSLESPLPAYSLGQLGYCPACIEPPTGEGSWAHPVIYLSVTLGNHPWTDGQVKALETCLRAMDDDAAAEVVAVLSAKSHPILSRQSPFDLIRELFRRVALSPHTRFAHTLVAVLRQWHTHSRHDREAIVDLVSYMLRHLCRHLTAFDLTTFHNFGANYPDALLLDELLRAYLDMLSTCAELASAEGRGPSGEATVRLRRRALRQAALVRRHYERHRVPDAPTSQGENLRVLPPEFPRVPEAQIAQPRARRKQLYDHDPTDALFESTTRTLLAASLADLQHEDELRELGMAVFLARPLGVFKAPGEVDRTPLVAYEAFSRSIARSRLDELLQAGWLAADDHARRVEQLDALEPLGIPAASLPIVERPGVVSLADAVKAAQDFRLIRSTAGSLGELFAAYDLAALEEAAPQAAHWLASREIKLLVPGEPTPAGEPTLRLLDRQGACRLELTLARGYRQFIDRELVDRLRVVSAAEADERGQLCERYFPDRPVWLKLRESE